jgi:hypothetical protein
MATGKMEVAITSYYTKVDDFNKWSILEQRKGIEFTPNSMLGPWPAL